MNSPVRALAAALLAVIGAFVGATLWSQSASRGIDRDAETISKDAAPTLKDISEARAELRELQARVARVVSGRADAPLDYDAERAKVGALIHHAMDLPTDPQETALFVNLHSALRSFDEGAHLALDELEAGHRLQARDALEKKLRPAADEVSLSAKALIEHEARTAEEAAGRIETARAEADKFAYRLDALCALLAVAAALLGFRVFRHVQRAEREKRAVTERKAEELEQFAGRVAHDILSPLSAVSLAMAIVEKRAPQEKETLSRAGSSLQRVKGIVNGLLEFARAGARPEAGARAEVRPLVAGLVEELAPFAEKAAARLSVEEVPECAVDCSPGVLLSLLGNLLRNAIKYLGDSKTREITLRIKSRRHRVSFEVEDTGPGIPAHLTRRVFEPYVRGPNTGTPGIGLGLATVKRLVECHGGSLGLRPAPQRGSVFWFELDESFPPEPSLESEPARFQAR